MFHLLQVLASQCLTALCASASGDEGCTLAELAEIDVLLNALLSPCFSVRDAALRVSRFTTSCAVFFETGSHPRVLYIASVKKCVVKE